MYKEFFQLERYPFQNTPDPTFFFSGKNHREALASMVYGVQEGKGFIVITGDVGCGKTMLVQALKSELGEQHQTIEIATPWVTPEDVLGALRTKLGILPTEHEEPALLDTLKKRLITLDEEGHRVVLVIDEAHQIPERTLEGIRLLSNLETTTRKLIQVILLGQDELAAMLGSYSLRQVQQRIALNYHLQRLDAQETEAYIQHRLRVAGGDPYLFPRDCLELIYKASQGSPRVINQLCDTCLLFAFGRRTRQITLDLTREAIANQHPEHSAPPDAAGAIPAAPGMPPVAEQAPATTPASQAAAVASAPPATPPANEPGPNVLPFQLPTASSGPSNHGPALALPLTFKFDGLRLKHLFIVLLLGLGLGALGVAWLLGKPQDWKISFSPASAPAAAAVNTTEPATTPPPRDTTRGMQPPSRDDQATLAAPLPTPAEPTAPAAPIMPATGSPAATQPPANTQGQLPLPGTNLLTGNGLREISISPRASLSMQASSTYGAWNDTVRDLILAANPTLGDPDLLPSGTRVRLPVLTRENLIVQDASGRFFVYFGSFEKPEAARINLEALRRTWSNALLAPAERQGASLQRLYIGGFNTKTEADSVAGSLWLKYLPALN